MRLLACAAFAGPFVGAFAGGAVRAAAQEPLVLTHARVLAADGASWIEDGAVLVRGGRIERIAAASALEVPPGATLLDLDGRALIPGLIDLHTHLLLHPYDETPWEEQVLKEPLERRTLRAGVQARATLGAGFTTIRELGTEGAGLADVALRDAIHAGLLPGPRIVATTRAIVATSCYGPSSLDPRIAVPKGAQEATGADEIRRVVREQIAAGADWIKVYADYHRRPGEPATPTFSQEELTAAVDEAKSAGRRVAAHATTDEGIRRALAAGVATIEHGDGASDATLAQMAHQHAAFCPTLAAVEALALQGGWKDGTPRPARFERALDVVRRAQSAGVTIACGSDAGVFAHGTNAREIELLVLAGLTPAAALQAATAVAADVLLRGDLGRIAPNAVADLVSVDGDPLADPSALRRVVLVVQEGRVAIDRRSDATPRGGLAEQASAIAFCRRFLADYSKPDFDAVAASFTADASIAIDAGSGDGRSTTAAKFLEQAKASRERGGALLERIAGEPIALVDGRIATVWAPFQVTTSGGGGHGIDVFQLVKVGAEWRISALAFTFRPDAPRRN